MRSVWFCYILIGFLFALSPLSMGLNKENTHSFTSSDPGWEPVIDYDLPSVFYQDRGILLHINDQQEGSLSILFHVQNGTIVVLDEWSIRRVQEDPEWGVERWNGESEGEFISMTNENTDVNGYMLAPDYIDENYDMTLRVSVWNGSREIYWEEHSFFVVGEPVIIDGSDPFKEIVISNAFADTMVGGFIFWGLVLAIYFIFKSKVGGSKR